MKKILVVLMLALALVVPTSVGDAQSICPGLTRAGTAFATERLTVSSTALPLTVATWQPGSTSGNWAKYSVLSVETDAIRYLDTGGTPTASIGHLVPVGSFMTVCGTSSLTNFRMIKVTADAPVQVTYYR